MGQANALTSGISGGINAYQNNQLMKMIQQPGTGYQDRYMGTTQYML